MQTRINTLVDLLSKYPVDTINKLYNAKEIELEVESFTKHADVKYSETLKKKMIQQAKRKKISLGRQKYLNQLIQNTNQFNHHDYLDLAKSDIIKLIKELNALDIKNQEIRLIHIEFSDYNQNASIELYGEFKANWWENELFRFEQKMRSSSIWTFLDKSKFWDISELLEIVEIEAEEYPQIFIEIWELRVFELFRIALNSNEMMTLLSKNNFNNLKVEIGMHDSKFHTLLTN